MGKSRILYDGKITPFYNPLTFYQTLRGLREHKVLDHELLSFSQHGSPLIIFFPYYGITLMYKCEPVEVATSKDPSYFNVRVELFSGDCTCQEKNIGEVERIIKNEETAFMNKPEEKTPAERSSRIVFSLH